MKIQKILRGKPRLYFHFVSQIHKIRKKRNRKISRTIIGTYIGVKFSVQYNLADNVAKFPTLFYESLQQVSVVSDPVVRRILRFFKNWCPTLWLVRTAYEATGESHSGFAIHLETFYTRDLIILPTIS